ncbi:MAG TPA: reductive dehalogenase domain-containing protein [Spirochaetota bacterium]|nr:reductive dehalogenase domain-containing protein [Spirochaetota bacterium]HPS85850.1 reductive dehalogenase domain-containing protein [Spirochaetota bacterium]
MKIKWSFWEIYGAAWVSLVALFMFYFATISFSEKEMRAAFLSFFISLLMLLLLITFLIWKRKRKLERSGIKKTIKWVMIIYTCFCIFLFIPTPPYGDSQSKKIGTYGIESVIQKNDAGKQPGSKSLIKVADSGKGNNIDYTLYDICMGKIKSSVKRDGKVTPVKTEILDSKVLTEKLKEEILTYGVDVVGITELKPEYIYSSDIKGKPVVLNHKYAIVIGKGVKHRLAGPTAPLPFQDSYSSIPEELAAVLSGININTESTIPADVAKEVKETMEFFSEGGSTAVQLAEYIRSLGYPARAHFNRWSEVQLVPLAILSGLGEAGKNGMIINEKFGPRGTFAVVTTDLPLIPDRPADLGVKEFCKVCNKCSRTCPAQAIPYGGTVIKNGVEKWAVDSEKCWAYLSKNIKCMSCISSCPYNKQEYAVHKLAGFMIKRKNIVTNYLIAKLDDFFGYSSHLKNYSQL